jgi:hypothetical protein
MNAPNFFLVPIYYLIRVGKGKFWFGVVFPFNKGKIRSEKKKEK